MKTKEEKLKEKIIEIIEDEKRFINMEEKIKFNQLSGWLKLMVVLFWIGYFANLILIFVELYL